MDSKYELKEIDIKKCACYFFDDITKIEGFDINNINRRKITQKYFSL